MGRLTALRRGRSNDYVEAVVSGKKGFGLPEEHLAAPDQCRIVGGALTRIRVGALTIAGGDRNRTTSQSRSASSRRAASERARKLGFFDEIPRGIAGERKLREHDEPGAFRIRTRGEIRHFGGITRKIPNGGIQLPERDSHQLYIVEGHSD